MKITFIRPNMFVTKSYDAMQPLAISILAGLTPKDIEVEFFDERIEELPTNLETDVVAISTETFTARRAYELSIELKSKGVPVIMGGIHPTFLPEESLAFCNSVIVGEAEGAWPAVIRDIRNNSLQRLYVGENPPSLCGIRYDRALFKDKKYAPMYPVQFGRGCKYSCDFCSIHAFFGKGLRQRPVEEVVNEIELLKKKSIFFVDDNIFIDEENTKKFLKALIPLKIRWVSQASIDIAHKPELLRLMAESGCRALIIGFESMDKRNLELMRKGANLRNKDYSSAVRKLAEYGIMVFGTFVFGYDYDTKDTFDEVLEFAIENKLMLANFNPLIPTPGTALYGRLEKEGRLIYDRWWLSSEFRYGASVFHPKSMSAEELAEGCLNLRVNFNKYSSMAKRLFDFDTNFSSLYNAGIFLAANLVSKKEIYKKQGARLGSGSNIFDLEEVLK